MKFKIRNEMDAVDILHRSLDEQSKEYDKKWWIILFPWMADKRLKAMKTTLDAAAYLMENYNDYANHYNFDQYEKDLFSHYESVY